MAAISGRMDASKKTVAVVGAGPAGLMAAEVLARGGAAVTVFEKMPTAGRRLLMAGRGGLNLTHSEPFERFVERYGEAAPFLRPILEAFPPAALVEWAEGLGQPTFVGSSGRVFPKALKASPLLRAWLARLEALGVEIRTRREWLGWDEAGALAFREETVRPDAVVLALGGGSWPKLGADGGWAGALRARGVEVRPFRPANCGFDVAWSEVFRDRFAGTPLKAVSLSFQGRTARGDAMITRYGLEGGAVYALSAALRDAIEASGSASLEIDLRPDQNAEAVARRLDRPRGGATLSNHLRKAGFSPVEAGLLRETGAEPKRISLTLTGVQPIDRAISSAGGLALSHGLEVLPGVFAAGEMLDWEAPTGGYLLQASFATGAAAARAILP